MMQKMSCVRRDELDDIVSHPVLRPARIALYLAVKTLYSITASVARPLPYRSLLVSKIVGESEGQAMRQHGPAGPREAWAPRQSVNLGIVEFAL